MHLYRFQVMLNLSLQTTPKRSKTNSRFIKRYALFACEQTPYRVYNTREV